MKLLAALVLLACIAGLSAAELDVAATAVNTFGLEVFAKAGATTDNLLLSPYSLQNALAMTYAGADGQTRIEMARVLHFPKDEATLHQSFAALAKALDEAAAKSAGAGKQNDGKADAIQFNVANRMFGQQGYEICQPFIETAKTSYGAPMEQLDFKTAAEPARAHINDWVAQQTKDKIKDLIPGGGISEHTRLVLTNAAYLKAPWQTKFRKNRTGKALFHVRGAKKVDVPTMSEIGRFGYVKKKDFSAVSLPYVGGELQFLILLPTAPGGLPALEKKITPLLLSELAKLENQEMLLYLPKVRFQPPTIELSKTLVSLGMKTAFDRPKGAADFSRMAPRTDNEYLALSEVFHKTFFALDEESTEAAAAAAPMMPAAANGHEGVQMTVKVNRPFFFAIQHRASGACLFLGRVTDPR